MLLGKRCLVLQEGEQPRTEARIGSKFGLLYYSEEGGNILRRNVGIYVPKKKIKFELGGAESRLGPLGTSATFGLLYLPRVIARMEKLVE
jgi:hypothetical protein